MFEEYSKETLRIYKNDYKDSSAYRCELRRILTLIEDDRLLKDAFQDVITHLGDKFFWHSNLDRGKYMDFVCALDSENIRAIRFIANNEYDSNKYTSDLHMISKDEWALKFINHSNLRLFVKGSLLNLCLFKENKPESSFYQEIMSAKHKLNSSTPVTWERIQRHSWKLICENLITFCERTLYYYEMCDKLRIETADGLSV